MIRKASVLRLTGLLALFLGFSAPFCLAVEPGFAAVGGQARQTADTDLGAFTNAHMSVEIVLAPRNASELSGLLSDLYDANSPNYQHWLAQGEFASRFAPDAAEIDAVAGYLRESGLVVEQTSSPFLLRASGPSSVIESAFHTALHSYRNARGIGYYSNASEIQLPESLAPGVLAVIGLSDTVRPHTHIVRPATHSSSPTPPNCEAPYPSIATLVNFFENNVPFPAVYGGGPGCYGLTPDQTNSIYGAPDLGSAAKGAGVITAVFELSAYQHSDIDTWTSYFYGPGFKAPLQDIIVDGGPLAPICPINDECPAAEQGYSGDIEVDADIETQLAIAPNMQRLLVYNAPNDMTGQTELDEYRRIADDDIADVISSSWGECENDAGAALVQAENLVFEQMALQGQSMFGSAGDNGFVDCIGTDGTTIANVDDPSTQPWVTSVGGTSFETFNPDANPSPSYPTGVETVWNSYNLCNSKANEYGLSGFEWCADSGAGGGGNSQFWGRPNYQGGPGITNPYTAYANGTTNCSFARRGTPCREVPDISADADPLTGYAEYCTGSAATPYSFCATITGQNPAGWFEIGGTSLSSPLWSGIIADQDSYFRERLGNANPLLYELYNYDAPGFFNDITGIHQLENNNGLFPVTPGYDQATGIGTPKMGAIITLSPQY
jgi:subtilase family serine protease